MAKETRKVISIETSGAQTSIADLRKEMGTLRDALLNAKKGTAEYDKILEKLKQDEEKINDVMRATKKTVDALPGSYNALSEEMKKLKERWKETNNEAERNSIGKQILEINNMKEILLL